MVAYRVNSPVCTQSEQVQEHLPLWHLMGELAHSPGLIGSHHVGVVR